MKRPTLRITAAIVTLAVAATAAVALAGRSTLDRGRKHGPRTFTISGTFSGLFDGAMHMNGHKVVVTKKTVIHSTREGTLEYGSSVARKPVFVSGVIERGVMRATMIVVREGRSGKREAGVLPKDSPR
jgi:hypothetical protein